MSGETSEEVAEIEKEGCIKRLRNLHRDVDICWDQFDLDTSVPRDLANRAEDTLTAIFGPFSIEMKRYCEYRSKWESRTREERHEYLGNLRSDLLSAIDRLENTSATRFTEYGLNVAQNLRKSVSSMRSALGLPPENTSFSKALVRLADRMELVMQYDCPDAAAFYLRKILEISIVERCEADGRKDHLGNDGQVIGLGSLIKLMDKSRSADGYIANRVAKKLLDHKILWDRSVHGLNNEPTDITLQSAMSYVKSALADMKIEDL